MKNNITLVVMAAGMGSRFGGLKQIEAVTDDGEGILDFSVRDAKRAGFNKVVFVIKKEIEDVFREHVGNRIAQKIDVEYAFQDLHNLPEGFTCPEDRTKPWGTGQAVLACRDLVHEPFAVINADDYYGMHAFDEIAQYLMSDPQDYCMTGFCLINTLSENGTVSRGVCEIKDGYLDKVTERTKIRDCKYTEDDGATWTELPSDTVVSMNLWGFTPDFFEDLETGFKSFLETSINTPKSEYYLPSAVTNVINSGRKKVRVFVTEDQWYGMTYPEDKQKVYDAMKKIALIDKD